MRLGDVCDGTTWKKGELDAGQGSVISFWLEGLPENADLNNVKARLGGQKLRLLYLEPPPGKPSGRFRAPARQVNAGLAAELEAGRYELVVEVGEKAVGKSEVELKR